MAITAADIQNVSFSIDRKGYDVDEVDVFLERVASEVDAMNAHILQLEAELDAASIASSAAPEPVAQETVAVVTAVATDDVDKDAKIAELAAKVADLETQLAEKTANDSAISQALIVAQRSADDLLANARSEASNIIKDADEEADRIIGKAESDRLKIADSIRALETDRADVRAEYREMLSNFMADAQKKLAEIDGDSRRAAVTAQARSEANAASYAPVAASGSFTSDSARSVRSVTAPSASGFIDKDFSGYGATDDEFAFDDID